MSDGYVEEHPDRSPGGREGLYSALGRPFILITILIATLFSAAIYHRNGQDTYSILVKAAELVILTAGLASLSLLRKQLEAQRVQLRRQEEQMRKQQEQMRHDHQWRTYLTYHELFPSIPPDDIRNKMYDLARELKFDHHFDNFGKPMPEEALKAIVESCDHRRIVRAYLDEFEKFCGAIRAGIVDDNYAYSLQNTRVIRNFTVFHALIKRWQAGNLMAYTELEKVATAWSLQRASADQSYRDQFGVGSGSTPRIRLPR